MAAPAFDVNAWSKAKLPQDAAERILVLQRYPVTSLGKTHCQKELDARDPLRKASGDEQHDEHVYKASNWIDPDGRSNSEQKHRRPAATTHADLWKWQAWLRKARADAGVEEPARGPIIQKKRSRQSFAEQNGGEEEEDDEEADPTEDTKGMLKKMNITMYCVMLWVLCDPGECCLLRFRYNH